MTSSVFAVYHRTPDYLYPRTTLIPLHTTHTPSYPSYPIPLHTLMPLFDRSFRALSWRPYPLPSLLFPSTKTPPKSKNSSSAAKWVLTTCVLSLTTTTTIALLSLRTNANSTTCSSGVCQKPCRRVSPDVPLTLLLCSPSRVVLTWRWNWRWSKSYRCSQNECPLQKLRSWRTLGKHRSVHGVRYPGIASWRSLNRRPGLGCTSVLRVIRAYYNVFNPSVMIYDVTNSIVTSWWYSSSWPNLHLTLHYVLHYT